MTPVNPRNTHSYLVTTGQPKHTMAEGIGCNFLISNQANLPDVADEARWRQVIAALDDLKMGWMRVGVIPTSKGGAWDQERQCWDFSHPHFQIARRVGQWAGERGVRLMFDPFAIPATFRRGGAFFADDPRDYARRLILPVAQFFKQQDLDAYRYLGLLNENIWGPGKEGFAAVGAFYELYRAVRQTLDEHGLDEETLGLLGPSNLSAWEWPVADFFAAGLDPDPLWVGYDTHLYLYHFDWIRQNEPDFMSLTELTERYLRRYADYAHKRNKPLFVTELGNMYCGRLFWGERDFEGPATHTSVLMDAELIVRGINEGVDGFLRWAFCVRPDFDGRWSLLENHPADRDGKPVAMSPSPAVYPMYRLLMQAVAPRAQVLTSTAAVAEGGFRHVFCTAVRNPDGSAALLLINDMPGKNLDVGLAVGDPLLGLAPPAGDGETRQLYRTVCDETRKGAVLSPVTLSAEGHGTVMLPPSSLTTLTTAPL